MAGENWTLQFLRHRSHRQAFPAIWWPVAMPWGALLTAITMYLMFGPQGWEQVARVCALAVLDGEPSVRPLAVLRIRTDRSVSLVYQPPEKLPGTHDGIVRRDYPLLAAPPLPEHLRHLAEEWTLVETESQLVYSPVHVRRAFFGARKPSSGAEPSPPVPRPSRPKMLLADQYRVEHVFVRGGSALCGRPRMAADRRLCPAHSRRGGPFVCTSPPGAGRIGLKPESDQTDSRFNER